jgi:hypothetical protein
LEFIQASHEMLWNRPPKTLVQFKFQGGAILFVVFIDRLLSMLGKTARTQDLTHQNVSGGPSWRPNSFLCLQVPVDFTSMHAKIPCTKSERIATSQRVLGTPSLDSGYK